MIPRRIFAADIDASARLLLVLLWTWADSRDPHAFVFPSVALLAGYLRCTTRSVRRSLQTLREAELITPARQIRQWRNGDHTVCGWMLARIDEVTPAADIDEGVDTDTPHPDVDAWADDLVREVDQELDANGDAADDVVRGTQPPADDLVTPKRTISSALPSMDLSVVSTQHDPTSPTPDLVESILGLMRGACEDLRGRKGAGPDDCDANRKLITRCNKAVRGRGQSDAELLADWAMVIGRQLANVRSRPETWKFLSLSTLARSANFLRLRDSVEGKPKRLTPFAPSHEDDE